MSLMEKAPRAPETNPPVRKNDTPAQLKTGRGRNVVPG